MSKRPNNAAILVALLVTLGGCMRASVRGEVLAEPAETFTGTATGYITGTGTMEVVSSKGTVCSGTFQYADMSRGRGSFACQDGREGPFQFTGSGASGAGEGRLGEARVEFTFGSAPH